MCTYVSLVPGVVYTVQYLMHALISRAFVRHVYVSAAFCRYLQVKDYDPS